MIYFIITASLFNECTVREEEYKCGISKFIQQINDIPNKKIIIVENNGLRETFLDEFVECDIFYTNNNLIDVQNKGTKELLDVFECISKYEIADDDFIVKLTGRYLINDDCIFINALKNMTETTECIIKYGSFLNGLDYQTEDCLTGLIGMTCKYVKQIEKPVGFSSVEWNWAKVTYLINENNIYKVNKLGINICPIYYNNTNYFLV